MACPNKVNPCDASNCNCDPNNPEDRGELGVAMTNNISKGGQNPEVIGTARPPKPQGSAPSKTTSVGNLLGSELALLETCLQGARGEDQRRIAEAGLLVIDQLLRKNIDYGSSAWKKPILLPSAEPRAAIQVRMSDKIERLSRLLGGASSEVSESIADTMEDLAGYAILWRSCPTED